MPVTTDASVRVWDEDSAAEVCPNTFVIEARLALAPLARRGFGRRPAHSAASNSAISTRQGQLHCRVLVGRIRHTVLSHQFRKFLMHH